ncbi:hypothetical protein [Pseudofulvibacter geojedonensis]|uniref:Lipoprotein n=1 Tax=Pseudofulvibacter geojedonensis TaxID=1123758 RepID=A0ABW3I4R4_9FLAO
MKPNIFFIALSIIVLSSCASIPSSTTTLTQEVLKESSGMHSLNISLINQLYANRKEQVNNFITNTYTPALLDNFSKNLPDSLNYKEELPHILKSIIPIINKKKDSMQSVLDAEQNQLIAQLNKNYNNFSTAGTSLQNLINSAVKLKSEEKTAISAVQSLTKNTINISNIENKLDSLLIHSGNDFSKLLKVHSIIKNN